MRKFQTPRLNSSVVSAHDGILIDVAFNLKGRRQVVTINLIIHDNISEIGGKVE